MPCAGWHDSHFKDWYQLRPTQLKLLRDVHAQFTFKVYDTISFALNLYSLKDFLFLFFR